MNLKFVVVNTLLFIFTLYLFVIEEGWMSGLFLLILFNLWQWFGSKEKAEALIDAYIWFSLTFGIIFGSYFILTEQFGKSDIRAFITSILITLIIYLSILIRAGNKKEEDRTELERNLNTIFKYTLYPIIYGWLWFSMGLIILFVVLSPLGFIIKVLS